MRTDLFTSIAIFIMMAFAPTAMVAEGFNGEDYSSLKSIPVSDTQYEWSQDDSKKIKVLIDKDDNLVMKSKEDGGIAMSTVELSVDVQKDEYVFGVSFTEPKPEEEGKSFGMILDYENNRNYKAIYIYKKKFEYMSVEDGESSVVKTGLLKFNKKSKDKSNTLLIHHVDEKIIMVLNGLEMTTMKRVKLNNPVFGAFVSGKNEAVISSFIFNVAERKDSEQSTTPN